MNPLDQLELYVTLSGQILKGTYESQTVDEVTPEMMNEAELMIGPALAAIKMLREQVGK